MVCFNTYNVSEKKVAAGEKKNPTHKRPLQISEELHSLVMQMAQDRNLSLEQVVAKAILKEAKTALDTLDGDKQRLYFSLVKNAEQEIKQRYIGERSRRSAQMRNINNQRRKKTAAPAPTFSSSPTLRQRPVSIHNGYPVEYRYGFAIPKPPSSSYPTYY